MFFDQELFTLRPQRLSRGESCLSDRVNHSRSLERFCYSFDHAAPVTRPCLAKQPYRRISRSGLNITPVAVLSNRNASVEHAAK